MTGKTISHYRIIEQLGQGGMGIVYKAEDLRLQRIVALKLLPPEMTQDAEAKERFTQEARAASALDHPNIFTIYEIGETNDGEMFLAMAYYPGRTLDQKIKDGPLSVDDALDVSMQICRGLMTAHEKGIVHRDVKPSNIVVTHDGVVKILDFGLAKLAGQARLTKVGTTVGTVAYMSPEQATGGDAVDRRTDIWSLGVVLYEMVTGQLPFKGDHDQAILYSILNTPPRPVKEVRPKLPGPLDHVLERALEKEPEARYHDIREFIADLGLVKATRSRGPRVRRGQGPQRGRRASRIITLIVFLVVMGYVTVTRVILPDDTAKEGGTVHSIAVLPLENLSGDAGQNYFADGMTEALITDIAKIRSLRVISRTSAMTYRYTEKTIPEIAGELDVDAIVTGSVLRVGDRVRVTAQLIDAATDKHLWNESYELALQDVLSVQREVAREVAGAIKIELTPEEEGALASASPVNTEAHEAFLKGRYHWNRRTRDDLQKSVGYFEQAIAIDPDYAIVYAGLAETYVVFGDWGFITAKDAYPKADAIARRALEIDGNLAEAYAVLAAVAYEYDWDWHEAERHFQKAITLNPNYATAHQWYAEFLSAMGRFDEALAQNEKAREVDPLSLIVSSSRAWILMYARDYDAAIDQCHRTLELDADFQHALMVLMWCYDLKGMHVEYVEAASRLLVACGAPMNAVAEFDRVGEESGIDGAREWFAATGIQFTGGVHNYPFHQAEILAELGQADDAMALLEKLYDARAQYVARIGVGPFFDPLRSDPRFIDLLRRVGMVDRPR
jgi:serine/threonine-protein kinase